MGKTFSNYIVENEWHLDFIYDCLNEKKFSDYNEKNRERYYQYKRMSKYTNIDECVQAAIESGNHMAFASMFYKLKTYEEKYKDILDNIENISEMCIIKQDLWNDADYSLPIINDKYIDRKKLEDKKEVIFSSEKNKTDKQCGKVVPLKSEIIQMAIYQKWDVKKTNEILINLGMDSLYPLNMLEAVEIKYLDEFANEKEKSSDEKLILLKLDINKYLKRYLLGEEEGKWFYFNKSTKKNGKTKRTLVQRRLIERNLVGSIGHEVKNNINKYTSLISGEINNYNESELSKKLTVYFDNELKPLEKTLTTYFEETKLKEGNTIISQDRIGLRNLIMNYIEHSDRYKKNVISHNGHFTTYYDGINTEVFINDRCKKFYKGDETYIGKKNLIIHDIMYMNNKKAESSRSERDPLKVLLIGEKKVKYGKDADNQDSGYEYKTSKGSLIRFAIATGNEDRMEEFMKIAGYWSEDFHIKDYYIDDSDNNRNLNSGCNMELDHFDATLIYAIRFRDKLIETWSNRFEKKRESYIKKFPFAALVNNISRDIQYAYILDRTKNNMKGKLIFEIPKFNDGTETDEIIWLKKYYEKKGIKNE